MVLLILYVRIKGIKQEGGELFNERFSNNSRQE